MDQIDLVRRNFILYDAMLGCESYALTRRSDGAMALWQATIDMWVRLTRD